MTRFRDEFDDGDEMLAITYDTIEHETDKAWLLRIGENGEHGKIWFPKSQCILDEGKSIVEVPRWLAEEKEIDELA